MLSLLKVTVEICQNLWGVKDLVYQFQNSAVSQKKQLLQHDKKFGHNTTSKLTISPVAIDFSAVKLRRL